MKPINILILFFLLHFGISDKVFLAENKTGVLEASKNKKALEENINSKKKLALNHKAFPIKSSFKKNETATNSDEIPVFMGGLKPLSENQKSPTFMPIEKGAPTSKALNGENFDSLNYTKANNIKIQLKNESQAEVPAGYYGESRITYY